MKQWFITLESPDIFRLPLPRGDDWDFLISSACNWERKEQVWVDVGNLEQVLKGIQPLNNAFLIFFN